MNRNDKVRRNSSQSLKDILSEIMNQPELSKGIGETMALQAWEAVLGKSVARITTGIYINKGIIYARINSSIVRSELYFNKDAIVHAINSHIGLHVVNDIVLR